MSHTAATCLLEHRKVQPRFLECESVSAPEQGEACETAPQLCSSSISNSCGLLILLLRVVWVRIWSKALLSFNGS